MSPANCTLGAALLPFVPTNNLRNTPFHPLVHPIKYTLSCPACRSPAPSTVPTRDTTSWVFNTPQNAGAAPWETRRSTPSTGAGGATCLVPEIRPRYAVRILRCWSLNMFAPCTLQDTTGRIHVPTIFLPLHHMMQCLNVLIGSICLFVSLPRCLPYSFSAKHHTVRTRP